MLGHVRMWFGRGAKVGSKAEGVDNAQLKLPKRFVFDLQMRKNPFFRD